MNVSIYSYKDYENSSVLRFRKNKANQSQSQNRSQKPALSEVEGTDDSLSGVASAKTERQKTKYSPRSSVIRPRSSVLWARRLLIDRMKPLYPFRKLLLRAETVFLAHLITEPGSNTPAELSNGVYKPGNEQYDIRHIGRCSSTVEHSFRKAGVEGPSPSIGCGFYRKNTVELE